MIFMNMLKWKIIKKIISILFGYFKYFSYLCTINRKQKVLKYGENKIIQLP